MEFKKLDPELLNSSRQTVFLCLVDNSLSMHPFRTAMQEALVNFKENILQSPENDEIIINIIPFGDKVEENEFTSVEDMNISYEPHGFFTILYDAIVYGRQRLNSYLSELREYGISTKGIMLIFSDGSDNGSSESVKEAIEAVKALQSHDEGNIVGFVSFGCGARGVAEELGIRKDNIWNTNATQEDLFKCFEVISKSVSTVSRRVDFTSKEESGILFYDLL